MRLAASTAKLLRKLEWRGHDVWSDSTTRECPDPDCQADEGSPHSKECELRALLDYCEGMAPRAADVEIIANEAVPPGVLLMVPEGRPLSEGVAVRFDAPAAIAGKKR